MWNFMIYIGIILYLKYGLTLKVLGLIKIKVYCSWLVVAF